MIYLGLLICGLLWFFSAILVVGMALGSVGDNYNQFDATYKSTAVGFAVASIVFLSILPLITLILVKIP